MRLLAAVAALALAAPGLAIHRHPAHAAAVGPVVRGGHEPHGFAGPLGLVARDADDDYDSTSVVDIYVTVYSDTTTRPTQYLNTTLAPSSSTRFSRSTSDPYSSPAVTASAAVYTDVSTAYSVVPSLTTSGDVTETVYLTQTLRLTRTYTRSASTAPTSDDVETTVYADTTVYAAPTETPAVETTTYDTTSVATSTSTGADTTSTIRVTQTLRVTRTLTRTSSAASATAASASAEAATSAAGAAEAATTAAPSSSADGLSFDVETTVVNEVDVSTSVSTGVDTTSTLFLTSTRRVTKTLTHTHSAETSAETADATSAVAAVTSSVPALTSSAPYQWVNSSSPSTTLYPTAGPTYSNSTGYGNYSIPLSNIHRETVVLAGVTVVRNVDIETRVVGSSTYTTTSVLPSSFSVPEVSSYYASASYEDELPSSAVSSVAAFATTVSAQAFSSSAEASWPSSAAASTSSAASALASSTTSASSTSTTSTSSSSSFSSSFSSSSSSSSSSTASTSSEEPTTTYTIRSTTTQQTTITRPTSTLYSTVYVYVKPTGTASYSAGYTLGMFTTTVTQSGAHSATTFVSTSVSTVDAPAATASASAAAFVKRDQVAFADGAIRESLESESGNPWAITYTPYTADGECRFAGEIQHDIGQIAARGFRNVRLYSPDCNVLSVAAPILRRHDMGVILGIALGDETDLRASALAQARDIAVWGHWERVQLVAVGNEAVLNGYVSAEDLIELIEDVREVLAEAGYRGAVTTAEHVETLRDAPDLCDAIDVVGVNVQPYFDGRVAAADAGEKLVDDLAAAEQLCAGKRAYALEMGWPRAGVQNGEAVASPDAQATAVAAVRKLALGRVVYTAYEDEAWKDAGALGAETSFGLLDLF
ncbi:uncharacterized protein V1510DRAFT_411242 [Dipodascopsis tothii]|uniref:uncharacterized protein n=1 Tax=Dipodascopsis tothii TaxID=44089 RepID=UPI0034CE927D